jgi:hypothetical protein
VSLRAVRFVLKRRKLRCPDAGSEDNVVALLDGTLFRTFDSGVGGRAHVGWAARKDPKSGRNRGSYSCRNSYATRQVPDDGNAQELSENMGTSVVMLNRSYFHHFNARDAADRLTRLCSKVRQSAFNGWAIGRALMMYPPRATSSAISVAATGCIRFADGLYRSPGDKVWVVQVTDGMSACEIIVTDSGDHHLIEQGAGCTYFHGASCSFSGQVSK